MKKESRLVRRREIPLDFRSRKGMEMVQVAILVAIAIGLGLIFKSQITEFVNGTFANLMGSGF
ncbi:MAG: hypothetical protein K6F52_01885 [Clostridia bacterium]|nr:hypothetical protein [Clostridia bacterium]